MTPAIIKIKAGVALRCILQRINKVGVRGNLNWQSRIGRSWFIMIHFQHTTVQFALKQEYLNTTT
jgi:hypothetical protein